MKNSSKTIIHGGMILVEDGDHLCLKCKAELHGIKKMLEDASNRTPQQCNDDIGDLCHALGLPCPDGTSSCHDLLRKCIKRVGEI